MGSVAMVDLLRKTGKGAVAALAMVGYLAGAGSGSTLAAGEQATLPPMTVYKTPTCGCCTGWVEHMEANGFTVKVKDLDDLDMVKMIYGVPAHVQSCHTAEIDGYVVEGHVPASDVKRLLAERPKTVGLSVPGMPIGSPGMEMGDEKEPYVSVLFERNGKTTVFERHH